MRIVLEEAFGPVASLYRAQTREDAVRMANQTSFGLSSAVWTNDPDEEAYFVANLDAGAVFVNGMTASYPGAAVWWHQGIRIRPRIGGGGHPRIHQRQDRLGRVWVSVVGSNGDCAPATGHNHGHTVQAEPSL